jgi:isoquinoline 1-oxidoreductase beta subunit
MNCTAHFRDEACEIWAPTQNPEYIIQGVGKLLGLTEDKIKINMVRAGGAFGRRYYADFCIDTVLLSKIAAAPIKVVWTREDDIHYDYFRPAGLHQMKAVIDPGTKIVYWRHKIAGTSRSAYLGWQDPPHDSEMDSYTFPAGFIPNLEFEFVHTPSRVPLGQWRSVSDSSNLFVIQSFLDEISHTLKKDPINFFLSLLGDKKEVHVFGKFFLNTERLRNVIELLKKRGNWGSKKKIHQGYGFAAGYSQGSFVALMATVQVVANQIKILKIVTAVDCGFVINPSGARAQVEGSIIEGLSAALFNKIDIESSFVKQSNFNDYKWIRQNSVPHIDIHFIDSAESPRGLGEPVLPMVAPAICNAIHNACGKRMYNLPVCDNGFTIE